MVKYVKISSESQLGAHLSGLCLNSFTRPIQIVHSIRFQEVWFAKPFPAMGSAQAG